MQKELEGKVVLVCGGSTGIGKACAARFAKGGANVVLLARRKARLDEAAKELGNRAIALEGDITSPGSVRAVFAEIDRRYGRLDVLLNVAGVARFRAIADASDEDIATVVGTNYLGPIYTTRAAIPLMRKAGGGDILNVSSEVTLDDLPMMTLYSSTKRALDGFTKTMTKELKPEGIRVTLVVMGNVAGTSFGDNFAGNEREASRDLWVKDGYLTRVAGEKMESAWVADAIYYAATRPRGMMMDVIHTRSAR
jgi:NAD(P)-dependent dehydrogenase (short-subunit alcohol dehydrogenase family)